MEIIKVSVIVPVYNSEQYLEDCLISLLHQTLKEIEIICVDDGSTDRSRMILNHFSRRDKRLRVLYQKNQFAGMARNHGMLYARGKYVCFLDSDDFFDRTLLEKAYTKAESSMADIVLFGAQKYDTTTKIFEKNNLYFDRKFLPRKKIFSYKDVPDHIMMITTPAPWTKLYRRAFIMEEKLEFQPLQNSNDAYFVLLSLCLAERISYINEDLVFYRVGQKNNLQSKKNKYPLCFVEAYLALYKELKSRKLFDYVEKSYVNVVLSGCSYNLDTTFDPQARLKICRALSQPAFLKTGILEHSKSYYLDMTQYYKVKMCQEIWNPYKEELKICHDKKKNFTNICSSAQRPLISVIIPVYNTEAYIKNCLDSVCSQTLENIEIIVVNDGTRDHSMEIILATAKQDPRIKIIHKENGGLSSARNCGLKESLGEYVLFLDSDDMLCDVALEVLYYRANALDLDDLFFNAMSFCDEKCNPSHFEKYVNYYKRAGDYHGTWTGIELFTRFVSYGEFKPSACLQLIKRAFLEKENICFFEGIIHEDNLFTMQCMLKAEKTQFLNLDLYFRRVHDNSIMTQSKDMKNVYGYYISIVEMLKTLCQHDCSLDGSYKTALEKQFKLMIDESVKVLNVLPNGQRDAYTKKMSVNDQILFDLIFMPYLDKPKIHHRNLGRRLLSKIYKKVKP